MGHCKKKKNKGTEAVVEKANQHNKPHDPFEEMLRKHLYVDGIVKYINYETNVVVLGRGSRVFKYGGGIFGKKSGYESGNGIIMQKHSIYHQEHQDGHNKFHGVVVQMEDVKGIMVGDKLQLFAEKLSAFNTFEMFLENFHLYAYEFEHMDCLYGNLFCFVKCVERYNGKVRFDFRRNYDYDKNKSQEITCVAKITEMSDSKVVLIDCKIINEDLVEQWIEATEDHVVLLDKKDIKTIKDGGFKLRDWLCFNAKVYQYQYQDGTINYSLHKISINQKMTIEYLDRVIANKEVCWSCAYDFDCDKHPWCCGVNSFERQVLVDALCDYKKAQRKYAMKKSMVSRNGFQKRVDIHGFVRLHDMPKELKDKYNDEFMFEVVFKDTCYFLHPLRLGPIRKLSQMLTYEKNEVVDFDYNQMDVDGFNIFRKYMKDNPSENLTTNDVLEFDGTLYFHSFECGVPYYSIENIKNVQKRTVDFFEVWRYVQLQRDADKFMKVHYSDWKREEVSIDTIEYCLAYRYYNDYFDYDRAVDKYSHKIMTAFDFYENREMGVEELSPQEGLFERMEDNSLSDDTLLNDDLFDGNLEAFRSNPIYMMPHGNHVSFEEIVESY